MRLWVANVGVNTNDARRHGLRSPRFTDGSFEFIPIPERMAGLPGTPMYSSLPSWTRPGSLVSHLLPAGMLDVSAHLDPDFANLTYGDAQRPRSMSLQHIANGDRLWFLARLWEHDRTQFTGASDFFFVGSYEVEANLLFEQGEVSCPTDLRNRLESNPHWHRVCAGDRGTFRVIFGRPSTSARFRIPIRVTPTIAGHLFAAEYDASVDRYQARGEIVRNKNGRPRTWTNFCSITRTIQWFLDSGDPLHARHIKALQDLAAKAEAQLPPAAEPPSRRDSL